MENKITDSEFKIRLCLLTETRMEEIGKDALAHRSRGRTTPPLPNASKLQAFCSTRREPEIPSKCLWAAAGAGLHVAPQMRGRHILQFHQLQKGYWSGL